MTHNFPRKMGQYTQVFVLFQHKEVRSDLVVDSQALPFGQPALSMEITLIIKKEVRKSEK